MSRSRGHGNVFVEGHERSCRQIMNSKAAHNLMIVCFLQRRLNTSYQKRLWWQRRRAGGGWVIARERWEMKNGVSFPYITGTIELVKQARMVNDSEEVLGRAYPDGTIWLHPQCVAYMPQRYNRSIVNAYLDEHYTRDLDGQTYRPKMLERTVPVRTEVVATERFEDIMNREWRV